MPGPLIPEGWADLLAPGIREWTFLGMDRQTPPIGPTLYNNVSSDSAYEKFENFGAVSPDAWDQFEKTRVIPTVGYSAGYKTTLTPKLFVVELPIEATLIEDAKYRVALDAAFAIGDSYATKDEYDRASVFNNAFTDTAPYDGADAVGLCSAAHPNGPENTGVTQNNEGTYSLTKANVATVRLAMRAFKDDRGMLAGIHPDTLIVPPALEDDALVIRGHAQYAPLDPTIGENALNVNVIHGWNIIVWDYLSDTNAWFMVDSRRMHRDLLYINRVPFSVKRKLQDETVYATWIARARHTQGWRDWRWIYGNNPS